MIINIIIPTTAKSRLRNARGNGELVHSSVSVLVQLAFSPYLRNRIYLSNFNLNIVTSKIINLFVGS